MLPHLILAFLLIHLIHIVVSPSYQSFRVDSATTRSLGASEAAVTVALEVSRGRGSCCSSVARPASRNAVTARHRDSESMVQQLELNLEGWNFSADSESTLKSPSSSSRGH